MNGKNMIRLVSASALLFALGATPYAAGLPAGFPQAFDWTGPIDAIRLSDDMVVINDRTFVLSRSARLHGAPGLGSLKKGITVGVKANMDSENKVIQDLWILPDGYQEP
jgi:hypothetical protein